ncbi:MAG: ABC transporter permease [Blastocatellales bacterium]|nr:ABC transporter permease [Blastocatellales bacterium]
MNTFFNNLLQDLDYGRRMLVRNPGFTIVAVLTLALGIGANTAIFSVVNGVLLRPLPYADADRLMMIRETMLPKFPEFSVSPGNFLDWQKQNTVFEQMAAYRGQAYILTNAGEPERLRAARVTKDAFEMLGARASFGRSFLPEEDAEDRGNVVVLSHGFWQRRFGGNPQTVGEILTLNGQPHTVVGIMPPTFLFPDRAVELWAPMAFTAREAQAHGAHYISAIGKLKPGVSVEQARSEMATIAARLAEQYPNSNAGWSTLVIPVQEYLVSSIKPALLMLLGAVALVLLIACANVANLLLVRTAGRQKEIAVRTALGAGRRRIFGQLLTESVLLSLLGGAAGLALAFGGLKALLALAPNGLLDVQNITLDAAALGFTLGVTVLTGFVFGLAPAVYASRADVHEMLKESGRGTSEGGRRRGLRNTLVVAEMALALVLLVGAGLLIRSFLMLQHVDPGFNAENVLVLNFGLPGAKYPEPHQRAAFFRQLTERVAALPGVVAAGATQSLPIAGDYVLGFEIEGREPFKPGEEPSTNYYAVSPDYFKAMGIRLLRGRLLDDRDAADSPRVVVINESMAKRYFADEDPIGKRIHVSQGPRTFREIVGIVADVKQYGLSSTAPLQTYEPYTQQPFGNMTLTIKTTGEPTALAAMVRAEVAGIDREQPVSSIRTMDAIVADSISNERFAMVLLAVFAGVALLLAAVGIYGVISYSVAQRTHEIGIRLALGAGVGDVLRLVVWQGARLAATGLGVGLAAAYAVTRWMSSLLFGVTPTDPLVFASLPLLLGAVALAACYIPALRAARVDPLTALREE